MRVATAEADGVCVCVCVCVCACVCVCVCDVLGFFVSVPWDTRVAMAVGWTERVPVGPAIAQVTPLLLRSTINAEESLK